MNLYLKNYNNIYDLQNEILCSFFAKTLIINLDNFKFFRKFLNENFIIIKIINLFYIRIFILTFFSFFIKIKKQTLILS